MNTIRCIEKLNGSCAVGICMKYEFNEKVDHLLHIDQYMIILMTSGNLFNHLLHIDQYIEWGIKAVENLGFILFDYCPFCGDPISNLIHDIARKSSYLQRIENAQ